MLPDPLGLGSAAKYLRYLRRAPWSRELDYLILFVTSRCPARCPRCFYRDALGGEADLSVEELAALSASAGSLGALLLSGGEPFARPELVEIVSRFVRDNGVLVCAIPTSGVEPERAERVTASLLEAHPGLHLAVAPSIDAPEALNDRLRFRGSFSAARETTERLVRLRRRHPRLEVVVHSVLSAESLGALPALMDELEGWDLDAHSVELVRDAAALPSLDDIHRAHRAVLERRARGLRRPLERVAVLGSLALAQRRKEASLAGRPFRCPAGRRLAVVDADGGLRACELLPPVGSLRDHGMDLRRALATLAPAAPPRCDGCTHECFIHAGIAAEPASLLRVPAAYLRARLAGRLP